MLEINRINKATKISSFINNFVFQIRTLKQNTYKYSNAWNIRPIPLVSCRGGDTSISPSNNFHRFHHPYSGNNMKQNFLSKSDVLVYETRQVITHQTLKKLNLAK